MRNAYQEVTERIVAQLESGVRPWQRPWDATKPIGAPLQRPLRSNGVPYTGANVLNLWCAADARGFASRFWLTYKGAQELGGQVRKGARAEFAFFVGKTTKRDEGSDEERTISFLKAYHVFNCDEITDLPAHYYAAQPAAPVDRPQHARHARTDAFVAGLGADIAHGGDRAYYMPALDAVRMPLFEHFHSADGYYSTLLHELTHWTGHPSRCARDFGRRFGDEAYAAEELVAELGAAFLCADLGICDLPRDDHASYIASWIRVLKHDNRAIFTAASAADKAATFMHTRQTTTEARAA